MAPIDRDRPSPSSAGKIPSPFVPDTSRIQCFHCKEFGHVRTSCPILKNIPVKKEFTHNLVCDDDEDSNCDEDAAIAVQFCFGDITPRKYLVTGTVNGQHVSTIWRDSGCSAVLVSPNLFPNLDPAGCPKRTVYDYLGRPSIFPVVRIYLKCIFFDGFTDAIVAPLKFCSVLLGNIPNVCDSAEVPSKETSSVVPSVEQVGSSVGSFGPSIPVQAVETRASKARAVHPLKVPKIETLKLDSSKFKQLQNSCNSLQECRSNFEKGVVSISKHRTFNFEKIGGLLYRKCLTSKISNEIGQLALVIPSLCRDVVLKTAHESILSGHFSFRKTEAKVREDFFWPGISRDIRLFCKSCDICQRTGAKGRVPRVPMIKMPLISEPFYRVSIDLVGPLSPPSSEGHKYILTLIDSATSFPEACALKNIDSISVAEALLGIFSRVGIPHEIHSDLGTQFTSELMKEFHRLLSIQPLFNTPYHPMGTGRIERLHSTLKSILRKLCSQQPREWHRYLIPTLFALREMPSDRTGYSAFELLYGRRVRGPLSVLRGLWEEADLPTERRTVYEYVLDLKTKLSESAELAAEASKLSVTKYKQYFDRSARKREFEVGEEALLLLPDSSHKLLVSWRGPYKILERRNKVDYLISQNDKPKLFHINLLKKYHRRTSSTTADGIDETVSEPSKNVPFLPVNNCVIREEGDGEGEIVTVGSQDCEGDLDEVIICSSLAPSQVSQVTDILHKYKSVISNKPGCTEALMHEIKVKSETIIRPKQYPIPAHLQSHFEAEVDSLLEMGIIRPSNSPHSSPRLLVRKPDGSHRLAIDFRYLNAISEFDAEPAPSLETELHKFSSSKYFSQLDICKAYYQILMHPESIKYTAFPSHRGLMEFVRMAFGLVTACSTYMRLMRKLLDGMEHVSFYFDNILIFTDSWDEHLVVLEMVFQRLREFNLTVKPSKCSVGFNSVEYLGFEIGNSELKPRYDRLQGIRNIPLPDTKTQLRSFLGCCQFYAKFVPNFANLSAPLTDMLKKGVKEPLYWSIPARDSFASLKEKLASPPILKLPELSKPFVLRTDASIGGVGGVLLQYYDDVPHPVAFASKKLSDCQKKYSTVERELLAIIFSVSKFRYYLLGRTFILEVDHQPLVHLSKFKGDNSRLMRWALILQSYSFRIVYIPGKENVGGDMLSRVYNE